MAEIREGEARSYDGTRIHYRVLGQGEPVLVLCDGLGCDGFVWKHLIPYFEEGLTILHPHYRGHGRSGKPNDYRHLTIEDCVRDVEAAMDHAGLARGVLLGHSMGVQVLLEAHARMPKRISGLVPVCGSYGEPLKTFHNSQILHDLMPHLFNIGRTIPFPLEALIRRLVPTRLGYLSALAGELNRLAIDKADFMPYLEHISRMDLVLFLSLMNNIDQHSAEGHLPFIDVPTLVVAGERDGFTPAWLSQRMVETIAGAELVMVPQGSHTAPLEQPDLVNLRIERFLIDRLGYRPPRGSSARRDIRSDLE